MLKTLINKTTLSGFVLLILAIFAVVLLSGFKAPYFDAYTTSYGLTLYRFNFYEYINHVFVDNSFNQQIEKYKDAFSSPQWQENGDILAVLNNIWLGIRVLFSLAFVVLNIVGGVMEIVGKMFMLDYIPILQYYSYFFHFMATINFLW